MSRSRFFIPIDRFGADAPELGTQGNFHDGLNSHEVREFYVDQVVLLHLAQQRKNRADRTPHGVNATSGINSISAPTSR